MHTIPENDVPHHSSQFATGNATYDALVLDTRFRQSLVTIQSLGSRGLNIAALEMTEARPVPAFSSRWCKKAVFCSEREGTKEYITALEQVCDQTGVRVLITSSDATVALLRQYREQLEKRVSIALAKEAALEIAVNKEQTLAVASKIGLNVPRGMSIGNASEVQTAINEVGLPAVVKPVESWVGNEQQGERIVSQLVTTSEEARYAVEVLTRSGGRVLFQQFLQGRREGVHLMFANGQVYARFAQWAKRTNPPLGGTSVLRQSIAIPPDIGEQSERLIREIGLEGYSEVEFRRDEYGKPYLMEINPRLSASIELAVRTGVDFPYLLYQWANGERIDTVKGYQAGRWMRFLSGDFETTIASLLQHSKPGVMPPARAILDFCASFLTPMEYDYLNWKDPLPLFVATTGWLYQVPKQINLARSRRNVVSSLQADTQRVQMQATDLQWVEKQVASGVEQPASSKSERGKLNG